MTDKLAIMLTEQDPALVAHVLAYKTETGRPTIERKVTLLRGVYEFSAEPYYIVPDDGDVPIKYYIVAQSLTEMTVDSTPNLQQWFQLMEEFMRITRLYEKGDSRPRLVVLASDVESFA